MSRSAMLLFCLTLGACGPSVAGGSEPGPAPSPSTFAAPLSRAATEPEMRRPFPSSSPYAPPRLGLVTPFSEPAPPAPQAEPTPGLAGEELQGGSVDHDMGLPAQEDPGD
jgi:hypothetical protein